MKRIALLLNLTLLLSAGLHAQTVPCEGAELNYRIVGFYFPFIVSAYGAQLEIAQGTIVNPGLFERNVIVRMKSDGNRTVAEVPDLGAAYTWRVVSQDEFHRKVVSGLFHFSTGTIPAADTFHARLRVTKEAAAYKDAYILADGSRVMYDMSGKPVWYLPEIDGRDCTPTDIKQTPQGSLTFLSGNGYEVDYSGNVVWKGPNDEGKPLQYNFHHEFMRLANGHYMALITDLGDMRIMPGDRADRDRIARQKMMFGMLVEYDAQGNKVWEWDSKSYYDRSDLAGYYSSQEQSSAAEPLADLHENSFSFDEANHIIYLNYKNINRIVKISYPDGNVIGKYGPDYEAGKAMASNIPYCGVHGVRVANDGQLLLFNNNSCNAGYPTIERLKEVPAGSGRLEKVWEYPCSNDVSLSAAGFPSGGDIMELPDHSLFVGTAAPDSRMFIVSTDKEVLWSAVLESRTAPGAQWQPATHYRASIIKSKEDLARLIWYSRSAEDVNGHLATSKNLPPEQQGESSHTSGTQ